MIHKVYCIRCNKEFELTDEEFILREVFFEDMVCLECELEDQDF